ncbi:thiamine phosphate synthase [Brevibacillus sp. SYP-B805]|uniref:thiamine phosphate synthase n=1 Tax=Brevibacillus sp. SYP-B805 TaxID=1578199 RepID=UPI0013ED059B|nr:thiamine phosphate synthase [Brevibacillus sp. SYP-B805]NGQ96278.1 thiamine phosphate synthase [Brevibacillus sp. SYP-B805]
MERTKRLREKLPLYFVVGSQDCGCSWEKTLTIAGEALAGGAGILQFRDKGSTLTPAERLALAEQLQALCRQHDALFFVNDEVELAVQLQADGIHVGQDDLPLPEVKRRVTPDMYIGVSAGTVEEAILAMEGGADYIGVGAMFATASKADAGEPIGPQGLAQIRKAVGSDFPIVGIGGIHAGNAAAVFAAGADGIAVISAISRAASPREAAAQLRRLAGRHHA